MPDNDGLSDLSISSCLLSRHHSTISGLGFIIMDAFKWARLGHFYDSI